MKEVQTLAGLALIVVIVAVAVTPPLVSDVKGCEEGGTGCSCCQFLCKHNRTGEK